MDAEEAEFYLASHLDPMVREALRLVLESQDSAVDRLVERRERLAREAEQRAEARAAELQRRLDGRVVGLEDYSTVRMVFGISSGECRLGNERHIPRSAILAPDLSYVFEREARRMIAETLHRFYAEDLRR